MLEEFSFPSVSSSTVLEVFAAASAHASPHAAFFGAVAIPVARLPENERVEQWYLLKPPPNARELNSVGVCPLPPVIALPQPCSPGLLTLMAFLLPPPPPPASAFAHRGAMAARAPWQAVRLELHLRMSGAADHFLDPVTLPHLPPSSKPPTPVVAAAEAPSSPVSASTKRLLNLGSAHRVNQPLPRVAEQRRASATAGEDPAPAQAHDASEGDR